MNAKKLMVCSILTALLLTFTFVPAHAALDWDSGTGVTWALDVTGDAITSGKDILKVGVGSDIDTNNNIEYIFRMYLSAAPDGEEDAGTIYNVFLGTSSPPSDYVIDSMFKWKYSKTSPGYGFTMLGDSIAVKEFSQVDDQTNHYLEWKVGNDQITDSLFYFMGATTDATGLTTSGHLYDQTEIAATPIPAAAWLLGSGIIGLIGIKRRNQLTTGETHSLA